MREQDKPGRGLIQIKLGEKRLEHLLLRKIFACTREIGPVAPVLISPEEKNLDAELPGLFGNCKDIGLLDALGVDGLRALYCRERSDAVAQACSPLELKARGGLPFPGRDARARPGSCPTGKR